MSKYAVGDHVLYEVKEYLYQWDPKLQANVAFKEITYVKNGYIQEVIDLGHDMFDYRLSTEKRSFYILEIVGKVQK